MAGMNKPEGWGKGNAASPWANKPAPPLAPQSSTNTSVPQPAESNEVTQKTPASVSAAPALDPVAVHAPEPAPVSAPTVETTPAHTTAPVKSSALPPATGKQRPSKLKAALIVVILLSLTIIIISGIILVVRKGTDSPAPSAPQHGTLPIPTDAAPTQPTIIPATTSATMPASEPTTAETTAPVVTTPRNLVESFTPDQQRKINIFLSNFSEQRFKQYPTDDYYLLYFVYLYNSLNHSENISYGSEYNEYYAAFSKETVDGDLLRFFGKTITPVKTYFTNPYDPHGNELIEYIDGKYLKWGVGSGEFYSYVTVVTSMVENSEGNYDVDFEVYAIDTYDSLSAYYYMNAQQIRNEPLASYVSTGSAIVKPVDNSYQLIYYMDNR